MPVASLPGDVPLRPVITTKIASRRRITIAIQIPRLVELVNA